MRVLIVFLTAALLPLFFGGRRAALVALAVQGGCLAFLEATRSDFSVTSFVQLGDLGIVRTAFVPVLLLSISRRRALDVALLPPDLFRWSLVATVVIAGFWFAAGIAPSERIEVGTSAAGVLVGLFVLSQNATRFGQLIAALLIENSITLMEVSSNERAPWPIAVALAAAFAGAVTMFGLLLASEPAPGATAPAEEAIL